MVPLPKLGMTLIRVPTVCNNGWGKWSLYLFIQVAKQVRTVPVNKCGDRLIWFQVEVCEIVFFPPPTPLNQHLLWHALMCQRKDHRRSMLTLVFPSDSCDGFWMRRNLNKVSCKTVIKTLILARPWHRNAWTYKSKSMQLWSLENVCKKQMKSMTNQFKMSARSRPKGGQGVQNEPSGVPEASRKFPKVTKTL